MLKKLERWFNVLMLLFLSNGVVWIATGGSETSYVRPQGSLVLHLLQAGLYGVVGLFILLHWSKFLAGIQAGKWVLILSLVALVSIAWSVNPTATATHGLALLATTIFGIYLGSCFSLRDQLGIVLRAFILIVLLSIAFPLLLPQYGVDQYLHLGSWQGIFEQKNLLGKAMVVAVIAFLSARGRMPGVVRWSAFAACIFLLYMSRSKTALLLIPVFVFLEYAYPLLRAKKSFAIPVAIALGMGAASAVSFAIVNSRDILTLLHRDPTLTGRTTLWEAVWNKISTHLALGFGFDAFWNGLQGQSASVILALGWAAKHSHNGFLDLLLDVGFAGLALFLVSYFVALRQAIRLVSHSATGEASWVLHYLAFMILYYTTEGQLMRQDSIYWALYVAVVVGVACAQVPSAVPAFEEEYLVAEPAAAVPEFAHANWGNPNA